MTHLMKKKLKHTLENLLGIQIYKSCWETEKFPEIGPQIMAE